MMETYRIDSELNGVLPELSDADYKALEQSLLTDGFKGAPIMVWGNIIVDGHNRYEICNRHNIPYEVKKVEFESKEEAMRWMVRQQIGRRTLTPLQRIQIVEKYRPFYKKKAKENQSKAGKNYGVGNEKLSQNSSKAIPSTNKIDVRAELAKDADVSTDTYSKGLKILQSGNQRLIDETSNGDKTINKAYKELKESQEKKSVVQEGNANTSDTNSELQNLKYDKRKEVSQKLRETREKYGIESLEYEDVKAEQLSVEVRINELENTMHKPNRQSDSELELIEIQKRYSEYLTVFQKDIVWLSNMEFYCNDEDVTGKSHSDLQNCLEKFKGIKSLMENMQIDDLDEKSIIINR